MATKVSFKINGESYTVDPKKEEQIGPETRLVDYIREHAKLTGTKFMCREGGCGACVVTVRNKLPNSDQTITRAVNSCLIPIFSCDGWEIFTIESLGNQKDGYHPIQEKLVKFGGTQCGYCSPGMVMNMYSALENNPSITAQEVEDSFDGNICRCTGYRPILDAFKSLASDAPEDLKKKCSDIEDLKGCSLKLSNGKIPSCCKNESSNATKCCKGGKASMPCVSLELESGKKWVKASSLEQAFKAIESFKSSKINYRILNGNTSIGIYKEDGLNCTGFLDITSIPELTGIELPTSECNELVFGGGVTLSTAIIALEKASKLSGFNYADGMSHHIKRIANVPVRNVGTLAGNLMIKYNHAEFPSDLFAILETVGAKVKIATGKCSVLKIGSTISTTEIGIAEFLNHDMKDSLIVSIHLKPVNSNYIYRSFKITKRYQNAHAYVNAGFFIEVDKSNFKVLSKPSIVYGGIHPKFVHPKATEEFLVGKQLSNPSTLQEALSILVNEINPDHHLPDATPDYRKQLAASLFYKVILHILGPDAGKKLQSGGNHIEHFLTSGKQSYQSDKQDWPLNRPVTKLEAAAQVSGEAEFINDMPAFHKECFGHLLLANIGNCDFKIVDTSDALKMPGVIGFYSCEDIPGENSYYTPILPGFPFTPEKVFADKRIEYAGQPIGILLAETKEIAIAAAKKIQIEYSNKKSPILTIKDSLKNQYGDNIPMTAKAIAAGKTLDDVGIKKGTIKGEFGIGSQYHFHMETQQAIVVPNEGCLNVHSGTQWLDFVQVAVARVLNIPHSKINMSVKRVGGGYGAKCSRAAFIASACAVGAYLSNRPVRLILDMESNMEMIGKRSPYLACYEVDYDENGKILRNELDIFNDGGYIANEEIPLFAQLHVQNCYKGTNLTMGGLPVLTHTAGNTACRAPGTTQGIAIMENIMEHIAFELKKDPMDVRSQNWLEDGDSIFSFPHPDKLNGKNFAIDMCQEIKQTAEIDARKKRIDEFNKANRWFKKGMAIVPMRYKFDYELPLIYNTYVAVYHGDGTVAVSHCGIEIGQGINTKVAQAVAHKLQIPIEKVSVKASNNLTSANAGVTGGSFTSELCCHSAIMACEKILERMEPFKKEDLSWSNWVNTCHMAGVDLTHNHVYHQSRDQLKGYNIWAVNVTEVEVDILTGEYKVVRVDLLEDAGKSLNPEVDVGQMEGALVMGLGLWTNEKLVFDKDTGRLLTRNTWEYKVPLPKDIPEDMRISFLSNAPNPQGVLRSKATGEPPLCTSVCVLFALKNAISAARKDAGNDEWFQLDGPCTPEDIVRLSLTTPDKFQIN